MSSADQLASCVLDGPHKPAATAQPDESPIDGLDEFPPILARWSHRADDQCLRCDATHIGPQRDSRFPHNRGRNCVPEARTVTGKIRPVHSDPFGDAIGCSLCDIGEVAVPTFSTRETGRSNTFLMVCIHAIGPFALERIAHL